MYSDEEIEACFDFLTMDSCSGDFYRNSTDDLVECIRRHLNSEFWTNFCIPPVMAILPQCSVYQGVAMAFQSKVTFIFESPNYVEDVLMPEIEVRFVAGLPLWLMGN